MLSCLQEYFYFDFDPLILLLYLILFCIVPLVIVLCIFWVWVTWSLLPVFSFFKLRHSRPSTLLLLFFLIVLSVGDSYGLSGMILTNVGARLLIEFGLEIDRGNMLGYVDAILLWWFSKMGYWNCLLIIPGIVLKSINIYICTYS